MWQPGGERGQRLRVAAGQRSILDGVGECHKGGAMKVEAEALLRGAGRASSRGVFCRFVPSGRTSWVPSKIP